jgi:hypothetical protein
LVCLLGVGTWLKLHTQILDSIPWFLKIPIVYKWKFNAIYKQYKDDKITNEILNNDHHDNWWHWNGNVMKHVSVSTIEIEENCKQFKILTRFW